MTKEPTATGLFMISYSAITDYQSLGRKSLPPAVKLVWDIRHIDRRGMREQYRS
jgi:hypothetical protein